MIVVGFGLAWVAYTGGFYGLSLLKGWNLSFKQIVSPAGYYTGKWPPPKLSDSVLLPTGNPADNLTGPAAPDPLAAAQAKAAADAKAQGRPIPGSVQGRY